MPREQQAKHVTSVPGTFFKFLSIPLSEYIGITKHQQIHKGKISPEPLPDHVDTRNFHITVYESTDTVLFCAFQKNTSTIQTPQHPQTYIKSACRAISTQAVMDKLLLLLLSQKGKICVIRTIRTRIILIIQQFCNFHITFLPPVFFLFHFALVLS